MKVIYCTLIVLLGVIMHSHAQELSQEFKNMYAKLEKLNTFQFVVDYTSNDTTEFTEEGKISVLITPQGYFYQTPFCEVLINAKNTILINDEDRMIIYSENRQLEKKEETFSFAHLIKGVDTLAAKADSVYFSFDGLERVYHLRFANQYFDLIELRFAGDLLKHVDYYYNERLVERSGIKATNEITLIENPTYNTAIFDTDFYFTNQNGKMVPTESFSSYGIVYNESTDEFLR
ncbi:hypothetical protein [Fluviicola sp.]|uniref:LolA family protein n=1 Tax=Fluviicola sp. TaxID=1917219 RepID=UPI0026237780|nr:hypothetical protein [Fluviicola sp.]